MQTPSKEERPKAVKGRFAQKEEFKNLLAALKPGNARVRDEYLNEDGKSCETTNQSPMTTEGTRAN